MPDGYDGTDLRRDQVGVVPDQPVICAKCQREMQSVGKGQYRCSHCGYLHEDREA
jgi:tRNA(Ile2) C34 agmatinyltransferase TiaS